MDLFNPLGRAGDFAGYLATRYLRPYLKRKIYDNTIEATLCFYISLDLLIGVRINGKLQVKMGNLKRKGYNTSPDSGFRC